MVKTVLPSITPHLVLELGLFGVILWMALETDQFRRILLIAPVLILYFSALLTFLWEMELGLRKSYEEKYKKR